MPFSPSPAAPVSSPRLARCAGALAAALLSVAGAGATEISLESPFLAAPGTARAEGKAPEAIQLSGITAFDSTIYACIADNTRKASRWLSVGGRWENVELVSCDPQKNEAVVRIGAELKTLGLRRASTGKAPVTPAVAALPKPPPPPAAQPQNQPPPPEPPKAVASNEEKEREARMFVSDMLEISMKQRKAYEEARKKAEQEAQQKKR